MPSVETELLSFEMEWFSVENRARLKAGDWIHDEGAAESPGLDNGQFQKSKSSISLHTLHVLGEQNS